MGKESKTNLSKFAQVSNCGNLFEDCEHNEGKQKERELRMKGRCERCFGTVEEKNGRKTLRVLC